MKPENQFLAKLEGRIGGYKNAILNNIKTFSSSAIQEAQNALKKQQLIKAILPEQRSQRGATPIATLDNGGILMSDGSIKKTPIYNQLQVLRQNVMDQVNFTPEAVKYLQSIPVAYYNGNNKDNLGVYSNKQNRIGINQQTFNYGGTRPTEVLVHEFLHALDSGIGNQSNSFGNSNGFYNKINQSGNLSPVLSNFLKAYPNNQQVKDVEAYVQYAAPNPNNVLLGPERNSYNGVFVPASRALNYSPVFATNQTMSNYYDNLFKELKKQEEF